MFKLLQEVLLLDWTVQNCPHLTISDLQNNNIIKFHLLLLPLTAERR